MKEGYYLKGEDVIKLTKSLENENEYYMRYIHRDSAEIDINDQGVCCYMNFTKNQIIEMGLKPVNKVKSKIGCKVWVSNGLGNDVWTPYDELLEISENDFTVADKTEFSPSGYYGINKRPFACRFV